VSKWNDDELRRIIATDDLHIAPFREDGATFGTPTWIWSVVVNGSLYARAYNGTASSWYQAAISQKAGQITIAGMKHDVTFGLAAAALAPQIDAAYKAKYSGSPYLSSMIANRAQAATVLILPATR
jgi:hypothetical protein